MRKLFALAAVLVIPHALYAQTTGTLVVTVISMDGPVAQAEVTAGRMKATTGPDGTVTFSLAAGRIDVVVTKADFDPGAAQVQIRAGVESRLEVTLESESELEENVVVSATRTDQRIEDIPLRVEVVPPEEVQEKTSMSPGDVSMLLAETNGLRIQTTSPALGGASLRIQGLSGRYSQILADGLPLYGAQSGSVGILQGPPGPSVPFWPPPPRWMRAAVSARDCTPRTFSRASSTAASSGVSWSAAAVSSPCAGARCHSGAITPSAASSSGRARPLHSAKPR